MNATDVVDRYFKAMQAGPDGAETLFSLFREDAVYIEPFSGAPTGERHTHEGLDAIKACVQKSWKDAPPEMTLEVDRVDVDGDVVRSEWTCRSPAFPGPMKGIDVCTVEGGRIKRLEVSFAAG